MFRVAHRPLFTIMTLLSISLTACQGSPSQPGGGPPGPGGVNIPGQAGVPKLGPDVSGDASKGDDIYKPHSNVDALAGVAFDAAEIQQLTRQAELPVADIRTIYENGKNARSTNLRTLARDESLATNFPIEASVFGGPRFLDTPVADAIAGSGSAAALSTADRRQAISGSVQRLVAYSIFQQFAIAEGKIRLGDPDASDRSHNYIDRAWALYVATSEGDRKPGSLATTALDLERAFGRPGAIDRPLREALAKMQDGAGRRNLDVFGPARAEAEARLNQIFYLATARQLTESVRAADRGDTAAAAAQQTLGLNLYMTIQASVVSTDAALDRTIIEFFKTPPDQLSTVQRDEALAALNQAAGALNLKTADMVSARDYQA